MKILHLVDDEKFIDHVIYVFGKFNTAKNTYLVGIGEDTEPIYIKSKEIVKAPYLSLEYFNIIKEECPDVIIVHYLHHAKIKPLLDLDKKVKILWMMWGADFYGSDLYHQPIFQKKTQKVLKVINNPSSSVLNVRRIFRPIKKALKLLFAFLLKKQEVDKSFLEMYQRFDYVSTVLPNEYDLLKKVPGFKAKYIPFSYMTLEHSLKDREMRIDNTSNSILIGNSNTPASNHLDVFNKIKINNSIEKIIVPLSYGGAPKDYKEYVIREGYECFKEKFIPITDFMSIDAYAEIVRTCRVGIFNHDRQQAVGNIVMMMYLGAKIFLSEKSPVYEYFKSIGLVVFTTQVDLKKEDYELLSISQIETNRRILEEIYSEESVLKKTEDLIKIIQSDIKNDIVSNTNQVGVFIKQTNYPTVNS